MHQRVWFGFLALALSTMALLFWAGSWLGYRGTLNELAGRGEAGLALATDRLTGQLDRYRYLPQVLSGHPDILAVLAQGDAELVDSGNRMLASITEASGALDIYLMDAGGTTIAASNWNLDRSFIGSNFAWRPYFKSAMDGGLGYYHAVGTTSGQRGFYFSYPVRDKVQKVIGVVAVKLDLDAIEARWLGDKEILFFSDRNEVIFLANRPSLILRSLDQEGYVPDGGDPQQYANMQPEPLPRRVIGSSYGYQIWRGIELAGLPQNALWLSASANEVAMTAHILVDVAEAKTQALLRGGLAATLGGFFWLMAAIFLQRRAALAEQLATEARIKAGLEFEVESRTRELSSTNRELRREIDERTTAQEALHRVQEQLVQAGKLRALGEMSAGISHELNQPLAAIQSLADNAEILMDRGEDTALRGNIAAISQLAGRAGRIIKNLRAFARKEGERTSDVNIDEVISDALSIMRNKIDAGDVEVSWSPADEPRIARGGRIRLQQVVINLVSNAIDAMAGQTGEKHIYLDLEESGDRLCLNVRDTGPGLASPEQIFDPFYSTKEVGEGLGLGLSISYGIVQSFGGNISGSNHADGGAVFTVNLARVAKSEVAA